MKPELCKGRFSTTRT